MQSKPTTFPAGIVIKIICLGILSLATRVGYAQITITGPTCVTPGVQYTYNISGNWTISTEMDWAATGNISGSSSGTPLPSLHVTFTGGTTNYVTVQTFNPSGSYTLNVTVTGNVQGGTASPSTQTIDYNTGPTGISCTPAAGGGCNPAYNYQWQQSTDNSNYSDISGATGQNYSPGALTTRTYFRRHVTETVSGTTDYSTVATVFVNPRLDGNIIGPASQQLLTGGSPGQLGGGPANGGGCSDYSYQWQSSADNVNFVNAGGSGQFFTPSAISGLTYYRRQASCSGQTANSNVVTVDIEDAFNQGTITPYSTTITPGHSPGTISSTTPTGGFCQNQYSYQWQQMTDGGTMTNIPGATGQSYTPGPLSVNTYYDLVTSCGTQSMIGNMSAAKVEIIPGGITPDFQQIYYGNNAATLSIAGTTGGAGTYTYQWQSSPDPSFANPTNVGTNSTSYTPMGLMATTYYRVQISSANSVSVYSVNFGVDVVYPPLVAGTITPASQTINYNTTPVALTASPPTGGNGIYTYQWYYKPANAGSWSVIPNATGLTYSPGQLDVTTYYELIYKSSNGYGAIVDAIVEVHQMNPGILSPANISIQDGGDPGLLSGDPASGGLSDSYSYQWYVSTDNVKWTSIGGATGLIYAPGPINATTYYKREASCSGDNEYTNVCEVEVVAPTDLNYIRTRDILKAGVADPATADGLTSPYDVAQVTQYFDGLGRPMQTVAKQATPLQKDLVMMNEYDNFGREVNKYLPFADTSSSGNFKYNASADQYSFNSGQYPNEQFYYSLVSFEPSPLNRPMTSYAPGLSWAGSNRGVGSQYLINQDADSVRLWTIAYPAGSIPVSTAIYPAGTLYKTITTDEAGHQIVEYKDLLGQVVLKKVQVDAAPGTAHVGWLCTYYVYDDLRHLRFVIQPQAVALINGNWSITAGIAQELCFRYEYDERGRMIVKQVPGAGSVYLLYDIRDRLVMTQDSNMRQAGQWLVTQYDDQNRQVETALMNYTATPANLQQLVTNQTAAGGPAYTIPTDTTLQGTNSTGDIRALHSITGQNGFSTADGGTFIGEIVNGNWGSGGSFSNNDSLSLSPVPAGVTLQPLTLTYYDDYNWVSGTGTALPSSFASAVAGNGKYFITSYNTSPAYAVQVGAFPVTRGQVTGTQTFVLGSSGQYLSTINFYDDRARLIQTQGINYTGGLDTVTTQYDFSGKPLRTLLGQAKPSNGTQYHQVLTKTNYDAGFRVTSVYKNIDGAAVDQLIDSMQYNELGQLRAKYLGKDPVTGQPLDSLVYDYNVRSWITGINKKYVAGTTQDYFGMELGYDNATSVASTTYTNPAYNGNIAGVVWKSAGDGVDRKYDFSYDNVNRLVGAAYLDNHSGTGWDASAMDYSVSGLTYDANGNILSMIQKGFKIGNPTGMIDSLTYTYTANSNKLLQVHDGANDTASVLGDFHYKGAKQGYDYSYDGNGSLNLDNNKGIDTIIYNYLNLPQRVHMKGKGNIFYTYDAAGNKLAKQTIDSAAAVATTTLYLDGFQYQRRTSLMNTTGGADTLQFLGHEEGRARWAFQKFLSGDSAYDWQYDFYERDHLGNTRVLLTQEKDTAQYVATMEAAYRPTENALFYNIDSTSYARANVPGYPSDVLVTNPNDSVARLNGNGPKVGPAIILKVMSGDKVDIGIQYYYNSNSVSSGPSLSAQNLLNSLASGLGALSGPAEASMATLGNPSSSPLLAALTSSIDSQNSTVPNKPQAYLNWILLDDQFHYVGGSNQSGALQVGASGTQSNGGLQPPLAYNGLPISKSGYLYIYVSNSSVNWDVFFDNLSVKHYSGPLVEENHYYPMGLGMAGLSDKSIKTQYATNKYRYNGKELQNQEFADGSGLEEYDYGARMQDPQLGLWHNIDPLVEKGKRWSPYNYAINNPVRFIDPDGMSEEDDIINADPNGLRGNVGNSENASTDRKSERTSGQNKRFWDAFSDYVFGNGEKTFASQDDAALAWSLANSDHSIKEHTEYTSLIYEKLDHKGQFYLTGSAKYGDGKANDHMSPSINELKGTFKNVLKGARVRGVIHNHPWTGQFTDLRFSYQIPLGNSAGYTYDRDLIDADENANLSFYLYAPDGILWVNRGMDPDDPYSQPNRYDKIIARFLPWDPDAREDTRSPKLGPYNKKWEWTNQRNKP